jgi:hypothetical protein
MASAVEIGKFSFKTLHDGFDACMVEDDDIDVDGYIKAYKELYKYVVLDFLYYMLIVNPLVLVQVPFAHGETVWFREQWYQSQTRYVRGNETEWYRWQFEDYQKNDSVWKRGGSLAKEGLCLWQQECFEAAQGIRYEKLVSLPHINMYCVNYPTLQILFRCFFKELVKCKTMMELLAFARRPTIKH